MKPIKGWEKYLIILLLIAFFSRFPVLLLRTIGPANPGNDTALYYDIAQNLKEGKGFTSDVVDYFCEYDGSRYDQFNFKEISRERYRSAFVLPAFLTLIFTINNSIDAAYYSMPFLFILLIFVFFFFVKNLFGLKNAFLSSLILIFIPYFIELYTLVTTESIYFILVVLTFYVLLRDYENNTYKKLILVAIITSLTCLTRYAGITLVMSITIWLLLQKRWKFAGLYLIISILPLFYWLFIRNYLNYGDILPAFKLSYWSYPPAVETTVNSSLVNYILVFLNNIVGYWGNAISNFASSEFLFLLAPFSLIGSVLFIKDKRILLFIIYTIVTIFFHGSGFFGSRLVRYASPTLLVLIPIGVYTLYYFLGNGVLMTSSKDKKRYKFVMIVFSFVLVFGYLSTIYFQYNKAMLKIYTKQVVNTDAKNFEWLKHHSESDDILASSSPRSAHYYTDLKTVTLPDNVNEAWFEHYIQYYGIDYIHVSSLSKNRFLNASFILNHFFENSRDFETKNYMVKIVDKKEGYGEYLRTGTSKIFKIVKK